MGRERKAEEINILQDVYGFSPPTSQSLQDLENAAAATGNSASEFIQSIGSSGGAYEDAARAAGAAAKDILLQYKDQIIEYFLSTRRVKIGVALGTASSFFSQSWEEFPKFIVEKLKGIYNRATDIDGDGESDGISGILKAMGPMMDDAASGIIQDPRVQESLKNINELQKAAETITNIIALYSQVKKIVDAFEPFFPIIEIIVTAASVWINPPAGVKFGSESAMLAMKELSKIPPLLVVPLKNYIFNKEVELPVVLRDSVNFLTPRSPDVSRFQTAVNALDAEYARINSTLKYPGAYDRVAVLGGTLTNAGQAFINLVGYTPGTQALYGPIDADTVPLDYLRASASVVTTDKIASLDLSMSQEDIIRVSKLIVDSKDTSTAFYVDRQYQKLILDELKEDGAILDTERQSYDEWATELSPIGMRGAFRSINNRITNFHLLLRVLIGDDRPDISEFIPVIDFYQKTNTKLTYKYTDREYNDIDQFIPDQQNVVRKAPITSVGTHEFFYNRPAGSITGSVGLPLNLAVARYPIAEAFYGDKERVSSDNNLLVESDTTISSPTVPGYLAGKWTAVASWDIAGNPETWSWLNQTSETLGNGDPVPTGSKYFSGHLLGNGSPIAQPLLTSTPAYLTKGLAEEYFDTATTWVTTNVITPFTDTLGTWATNNENARLLKVGRAFSRQHLASSRYKKDVDRIARDRSRVTTSITPSDWNDKVIDYDNGSGSKKFLHLTDSSTRTQIYLGTYRVIERVLFGLGALFTLGLFTAVFPRYSREDQLRAIEDAQRASTSASSGFPYFVTAISSRASGTDREIESIHIVTPHGFLNNKTINAWTWPRTTEVSDTILFSTSDDMNVEDTTTALGDLYLCSTNVELAVDDAFILIQGPLVLLLKVTAASYINPHEAMSVYGDGSWVGNFRITHSSSEYIYEHGVTAIEDRPKVTVIGDPCWVYSLETISVAGDTDLADQFLPLSNREWLRNPERRHVAWRRLEGDFIIRNLPDISGGGTYSDQLRTIFPAAAVPRRMRGLDRLISEDAIGRYVKGKLANLDATDTGDLKMKDIYGFLRPWADPQLVNLVGELTTLYSEIGTLDVLFSYVQYFNFFRSQLENIFTEGKGVGAPITLEQCKTLDRLFGNAAPFTPTGSAEWPYPWLSIDAGSPPTKGTITSSDLATLVNEIYTKLNGNSGVPPVRRLEGQALQGDPKSLYYRRYLYLNNRMNKTEGPLAKAEMFQFNWELMKERDLFKSDVVESYGDLIDARPVLGNDQLKYLAPEGDETEGIFFVQDVLDTISGQISDKCLLICSPCPVKDSCPFYDEAGLLRLYAPRANSINLYFKDNQLDLLEYELDSEGSWVLPLTTTDGKRLPAPRAKKVHYPYAEITNDDETIRDLDEVRDIIADKVPGFRDSDGVAVDGMDWIQGGRYGSLELAQTNGAISSNPQNHKYLYDALFIRDEESEFVYESSNSSFPVELEMLNDTGGIDTYTGEVRLKKPSILKILDEADLINDVYLVSDDSDPETKRPIPPLYLGRVGEIVIDYDFDETQPSIDTEDDFRWISPSDMAQFLVNQINEFDASQNKYWMPTIKKTVKSKNDTNQTAVVALQGRPRVPDVVDPLITESPSELDILRGKPFVKPYINFVRRIRISLDSVKWSKSNDPSEVERAKSLLPYMKSNLRLAVVRT